MSNDTEDIFEEALDAASEAFRATLDRHFGRTFDGSEADQARVYEEYRASAQDLRDGGRVLHLRTGLVDADFTCWLSGLADENFAEDSA